MQDQPQTQPGLDETSTCVQTPPRSGRGSGEGLVITFSRDVILQQDKNIYGNMAALMVIMHARAMRCLRTSVYHKHHTQDADAVDDHAF